MNILISALIGFLLFFFGSIILNPSAIIGYSIIGAIVGLTVPVLIMILSETSIDKRSK